MIHVRNLLTPTFGSATSMARFLMWCWREILLLGKWTETANNGDSGWGSGNYLATYSDLVVDPANPCIVTTAGGSFTGHDNRILTLYDPTNDANRVIANIRTVVNSTTIYLQPYCLPKPWVAATGLTGKIHNCGQTVPLTAGAWVVMTAPGGGTPLQVKLNVVANNSMSFAGLPLGDYAGTPHYTATITQDRSTADERAARLNADIDGDLANIFGKYHTTSAVGDVWIGMCCGSLLNAAPGDTPKFVGEVYYGPASSAFYPSGSRGFGWGLRMIGPGPTYPQIQGYVSTPKAWSNATHVTADNLYYNEQRLWARRRLLVGYPWVIMEDTADGGYWRGQFPWLCANAYWADWRSLDGVSPAPATLRSIGMYALPHAGKLGCDVFAPLATMGF